MDAGAANNADAPNDAIDTVAQLDAHEHMKGFPKENTGTHLGSAGQERVARFIADGIAPWIVRSRNGCS
jgi:hypothetical protein